MHIEKTPANKTSAKMNEHTGNNWFDRSVVNCLREMIIDFSKKNRLLMNTEEFETLWDLCDDYHEFYEENFDSDDVNSKILKSSLFYKEKLESHVEIEKYYLDVMIMIVVLRLDATNHIPLDIISPGVPAYLARKSASVSVAPTETNATSRVELPD